MHVELRSKGYHLQRGMLDLAHIANSYSVQILRLCRGHGHFTPSATNVLNPPKNVHCFHLICKFNKVATLRGLSRCNIEAEVKDS